MRRVHWAALVLGVLIGLWVSPGRAYSATAEPYGGCDEAWQAPHSQGATWCRNHGYYVSGHVVLNPERVVLVMRWPACASDDGEQDPCYWNAEQRGNGKGRSFWIDPKGRIRYVAGWTSFVIIAA